MTRQSDIDYALDAILVSLGSQGFQSPGLGPQRDRDALQAALIYVATEYKLRIRVEKMIEKAP